MRKLTLSLIVALGAVPGPVVAQQQSLVPFLPKGTVVAVSVPDLDASIGEFSSMPLAKMWHEEEVQNFVRDARELAKQQIDKALEQAKAMHAQGEFPVDPEKLLALRVRGGTVAVTQLGLEVGDFGPLPKVGLMVHLDFGSTSADWFALLQLGLGMLQQTVGDDMERTESKVGETQIISLMPKNGPPGMEMGLNIAMVKDGLIVATLRDELTATVESMQAGKPVLAATDQYKANAKHISVEGAEAMMFMRPDLAIDFLVQGLGIAAAHESQLAWLDVEGVGRAIDALGLRGIHSVGATSSYQDGKAVSTTYVVAPAPERKGFLAGANKNLDQSFLRWVPKDAVSFTGLTMEPMSIYDAMVGALQAYDAELAKGLLGKLAEMEQQVGFSIRDDFFGALGDTLITWSMPMATVASPPETAILLKVKDQEKLVKVIKTLAGMSNGTVELYEAEKRGVKTFKTFQFRVNFDPTQGMGMNLFDIINPTFAFKDDYLVAGFSASDIRRVFERMERTDDDPKSDIRGNKEFAGYAGSLPAEVQSLSFTDWKAQFESYYQMLTSVLAFVPMNEDVPIDMSLLPDVATLTKHLYGSLSYSIADGGGFAGTTISPFGPEVAVLVAAAVVAGASVFAMTTGNF